MPKGKLSEVIYTDDYGDVTRRMWNLWRKRNVTPAEHDDMVDHFGRGAHDEMVEWVESHTVDGSYRAPWPWPR